MGVVGPLWLSLLEFHQASTLQKLTSPIYLIVADAQRLSLRGLACLSRKMNQVRAFVVCLYRDRTAH